GVSRLMRPSSSSSPQSPHVEPSGRCFQRGAMRVALYRPVQLGSCHGRTTFPAAFARGGTRMIGGDFVVPGAGHLPDPVDLFKTRRPAHLRDRAVWEEDFELDEPWVD